MVTDTATSSPEDESKTKPQTIISSSEVKYPEQTTADERSSLVSKNTIAWF